VHAVVFLKDRLTPPTLLEMAIYRQTRMLSSCDYISLRRLSAKFEGVASMQPNDATAMMFDVNARFVRPSECPEAACKNPCELKKQKKEGRA
jgi:hypothetical protein